MSTPHNRAGIGDIAETVLLPGDPLRAKYIAENYLEDITQFNDVRNMFGFTGSWKGKQISVMGSGMGIPSISIYAEELCRVFKAKRLIRVGSCGAIQPELKLYDIIIGLSACTDSAINKARFKGATYAPTANFSLVQAAYKAAAEKGIAPYVGPIASMDLFYGVEGEDLDWQMWAKYGVLALEMESAGLYTIAARYGIEAVSLLTVSDSLVHAEVTTPEARETSFNTMMEIALAIA